MDATVSVSKGCFVYKNRKSKKGKDSAATLGEYSSDPWYQAYKNSWSSVKDALEIIEHKVFTEVLEGLVKYIEDSHNLPASNEIPAATLLTGVNMPDHGSLFATLTSQVTEEVTPHVVTLWSRDCTTLRGIVERMCAQFMSVDDNEDSDAGRSEDEDDEDSKQRSKKNSIQRWHCNLPVLLSWYKNLPYTVTTPSKNKKRKKSKAKQVSRGKPLVVILPDLESFPAKVLQDFVLILSGYRSQLPFVLVLGVATAVSAVHRSLPHHVSSRVRMSLFHTQPSCTYLNEILEQVFLTPERSVHLGGKTFDLLTNVFLFYDFSVTGFIQGFKYCMTEHFFGKNWTLLSCSPADLPHAISQLTKEDIESIRKLPSIRRHIESLGCKDKIIAWLKDDAFVKGEVERLLGDLRKHVAAFYTTLRCLHTFTASLPKAPLGKHLRGMYASAVSNNVNHSTAMREALQLLGFQSRDELEEKLGKTWTILQEEPLLANEAEGIEELVWELKVLAAKNGALSTPSKNQRSPLKSPTKSHPQSPTKSPSKLHMGTMNRAQFREKLSELSVQQKQRQSPYEELRARVLSFLVDDLFVPFLLPPTSLPLHEVVFFDDVAAVKSHIVGSPRQAVLRALKDPHHYLQCQCCKLSDANDIQPSLPDVSIVYKLHLESGKLINMYDWLQSFLTIVNPTGEEQRDVDPKLQARFTRAVAELQFLGFIKTSSRKTDHVTRLTWG